MWVRFACSVLDENARVCETRNGSLVLYVDLPRCSLTSGKFVYQWHIRKFEFRLKIKVILNYLSRNSQKQARLKKLLVYDRYINLSALSLIFLRFLRSIRMRRCTIAYVYAHTFALEYLMSLLYLKVSGCYDRHISYEDIFLHIFQKNAASRFYSRTLA